MSEKPSWNTIVVITTKFVIVEYHYGTLSEAEVQGLELAGEGNDHWSIHPGRLPIRRPPGAAESFGQE